MLVAYGADLGLGNGDQSVVTAAPVRSRSVTCLDRLAPMHASCLFVC